MSQPTNWAVPTVGPQTPTAMAQRMKDSLDGLLSSHSGATAPAYRVVGTIWCDTATANRLIYKVWDGSAWVTFLTINTSTDAARLSNINPVTTLASAATTTLASIESDAIEITGTTGITSFGAAEAGLIRFVRFAGVLLLTHSSALLLPAATNITTAAGDSLVAISLGSGNWRVLSYTPATIRVALPASRAVTSGSSAGDRTFTAADAGKFIALGGSANFTMSFEPAATLGNGWSVDVSCTASVTVTLDPSGAEQIDGATTITLARGQNCRIICDGTQLRSIGRSQQLVLGTAELAAGQSFVEFELPLAYRLFQIEGDYTLTAAGGWVLAQLSNDGGSSWSTTGYVGVFTQFGNNNSYSCSAGPVTGLTVSYFQSDLRSPFSAVLNLRDTAGGNTLNSDSAYTTAGVAFYRTTHSSFLNATLAGVNRMRLASSAGQFAAASRFTLIGVR